MTDFRRAALLSPVATLTLAACTSSDRPTVQADEVVLPTPLRSVDASIAPGARFEVASRNPAA